MRGGRGERGERQKGEKKREEETERKKERVECYCFRPSEKKIALAPSSQESNLRSCALYTVSVVNTTHTTHSTWCDMANNEGKIKLVLG